MIVAEKNSMMIKVIQSSLKNKPRFYKTLAYFI